MPPELSADAVSERSLTHLGAAVGSLAHDLQNLMLALRLDAGRLVRTLGDDHPAYPESLIETLDQLDELVARLGRLSESAPEVVDSASLLRRVVAEARERGALVDADLIEAAESSLPEDLPPLRCDPLLLRLAFVHLLCAGDDDVELSAHTDDGGDLVVEISGGTGSRLRQADEPSHAEFGRDPGATVVARAVRLARGRIERSESGLRIVLPAA